MNRKPIKASRTYINKGEGVEDIPEDWIVSKDEWLKNLSLLSENSLNVVKKLFDELRSTEDTHKAYSIAVQMRDEHELYLETVKAYNTGSVCSEEDFHFIVNENDDYTICKKNEIGVKKGNEKGIYG